MTEAGRAILSLSACSIRAHRLNQGNAEMRKGYYLRKGDRTTCGGYIMDGDSTFKLYGIPRAREGDEVTCGVDGKTYHIHGGISFMKRHGRRLAGTLDSVSSCGCRAGLMNSTCQGSYTTHRDADPASNDRRSADEMVPAQSRQGAGCGHPSARSTPAFAQAACDQCFEFLNHQHLPIGHADYVLMQDDQCIGYAKLDEHGHSRTYSSANPTELQLAINAQSPVLE